MNFTDIVTVAGTRRTGDGYLVADARIARTGIQTYSGVEIGRPEMRDRAGLSARCGSLFRGHAEKRGSPTGDK